MQINCSQKLSKAVEMLKYNLDLFGKAYIHFLRFSTPTTKTFAEFLDSWKVALLRLGLRPLLCWYLNLGTGEYSVILFTNAYVSGQDLERLRDATARVWALYGNTPYACVDSDLATPDNAAGIIPKIDAFIDAASSEALRSAQHIRTFGTSAL